MEEDADQEIEELKEKYEVKLAAEREQHLRLKVCVRACVRACG